MKAIGMTYREILRASLPPLDPFFQKLAVVGIVSFFVYIIYVLGSNGPEDMVKWEKSVQLDRAVLAFHDISLSRSENETDQITAVKSLTAAVTDAYSEKHMPELMQGLLALLSGGISLDRWTGSESIRNFFANNEIVLSPFHAVIVLSSREGDGLHTIHWKSLGSINDPKRIKAVWPAFDIPAPVISAYARLYAIEHPAQDIRYVLDKRLSDVLQAISGNIVNIKRAGPPPTMRLAFTTLLMGIAVLLWLVASWLMWMEYLKTVKEAGLRPWNISWNLVTIFLMAYFAPAIFVSGCAVGIKKAIDQIGHLAWSIATLDFSRILRVVTGRELYITGDTREHALRLLFQELGLIEFRIKELSLRALTDNSAQLHNEVHEFERRQQYLEERIRLVQPDETIRNEVYAGMDFAELQRRFHALQKMNPSLPTL